MNPSECCNTSTNRNGQDDLSDLDRFLPYDPERRRRRLAHHPGAAVAANVDIDNYLTVTVYPALFGRLAEAMPEFGWVKHGNAWEATRWPADFPYQVQNKHPDRLMVYPDRPWWIKVHGHSGIRFLDLVNGGRRAEGPVFLEVVAKVCQLAGVPCPFQDKPLSPEQEEKARRQEARRAILEDLAAFCASTLWSHAGEAARVYLRERGLRDDEIREIGFGLLLSVRDLWNWLKSRGHTKAACRDAGVLWPKLEGFIIIPWQDEHGRPLTAYGRWPGSPPLMKDLLAWRPKRDELCSSREQDRPWEEPRVPKTIALPGKDTKSSPFCFDRARRAGHREVVLLEGVFDAILLQVRGDTRAIASVAAQLTGEQVKTLTRCRVERVFICGDPDGGGDRGTLANVESLIGAGLTAYVVPRLPDHQDPDEFVLRNNVETWKNYVKRSDHAYRYRAKLILEKHKGKDAAWTDSSQDAAIVESVTFAAGLPTSKDEELARHFWPEIVKATRADVEALKLRTREARQKAEAAGQQVGGQAASRPAAFVWAPIDSTTFAKNDYKPVWLVKHQLVKGQPVVIGGPRKVLKTSALVDLAISLATGLPFLRFFTIYRPLRVAVLSGESGEFTIQETAKRVCKARDIDLADIGRNLLWQFKLPQLAKPENLKALGDGLRGDGVDVVINDPTYLSLLSGRAPTTPLKAENLFDMGPLLLGVTESCLDAGATPILVHHTRKDTAAKREPLELDDLAYAGFAEFARQWLLLSRREAYKPGTGVHKLWWNVGGSTGQGGLWAVDIDEGVIDEDFSGRRWEVTVCTAAEAREGGSEAEDSRKREKQERQDKADDAALLKALDQLDPLGNGFGLNKIKSESRLSDGRMDRSVRRLTAARLVEEIEVEVEIGSKAKRPVKGLKRSSRTG